MNEENKERLSELLADRATQGLTAEELAELKFLQEQQGKQEDDSFDIAAAALSLTIIRLDEPMPTHLRSRLVADADKFFAASQTTEKQTAQVIQFPLRKNFIQWAGWAVAAAACVILAIVFFANRPTTVLPKRELTLTEQREQLIAKANIIQTSWKGTTQPEAKDVVGDVVWNNAEQKGFMRFRGLPVNDVSKETYQLWIFDANQDEKFPIDGGVFDVKENGEVIIPIDAKIKVTKPTLFAVTIEKPSGVVVSKRDRLVLIAQVQ
jgi:anti-sigma-K factor RskA